MRGYVRTDGAPSPGFVLILPSIALFLIGWLLRKFFNDNGMWKINIYNIAHCALLSIRTVRTKGDSVIDRKSAIDNKQASEVGK